MAEKLVESDYIVYVDESGDHGLESVDPHYPIFVLAYCVFEKESYRLASTPALQGFKFTHFGHDMVILHEREIRQAEGEFAFLVDPARRGPFMADLSNLIAESEFTVIATVIKKQDLLTRYTHPENPYHLALAYGLERVQLFLEQQGQDNCRTHLIFERRGKREDEALELEFRRVCSGANYKGQKLPFEIRFADKKVNSCGLQLADLVARPIGRHILNPKQRNRAWEILREKLFQIEGRLKGLGLKVFP